MQLAALEHYPVTVRRLRFGGGSIERFMATRALTMIDYVIGLVDDPSEYHGPTFDRLERFAAERGA